MPLCLRRYLFYTLTGTARGPDPDYTRQTISLIFSVRVAISIVFFIYISYYMLKLRTDKISLTIGWIFALSVYTQFIRDFTAYQHV